VKPVGGKLRAIRSFGVVNGDDLSAKYFDYATKRRIYRFSTTGKAADLSLTEIESGADGNAYEVKGRLTGNGTLSVYDELPGAFNAGNVLAALIVVTQLSGASLDEVANLVPQLRPVRGRMTSLRRGQPFEVLVDYAHTPASFEIIFPPLKKRISSQGGRVISLFGSGGERDTQKRPIQGRIAAEYSDVVILTDEDPRGEKPLAILEDIAAGITDKTRGEDLLLIPERPTAIRKAFSLAKPGDLVLLLGKGHENSIIYDREACPYDEIAEAEKALLEMGFN
jgi:UDP-N-acetylmuramoyl-L-alanyl-D-glutamate--2,6-diaminopimelate ligase